MTPEIFSRRSFLEGVADHTLHGVDRAALSLSSPIAATSGDVQGAAGDIAESACYVAVVPCAQPVNDKLVDRDEYGMK